MKSGAEVALIVGAVIVLIILIFLAFPWFIMLAWGAFMVPVFGLPYIDWWQALGLFVLSNLLLKSSTYTRKSK